MKGEAKSGTGNERPGRKGEESGAGTAGEVAQAVPGRGRDPAEFPKGVELEVEDDEREVAIAQEKIGTAKRFPAVLAAHPEEAGTGGGAIRGGIEGVVPIDEG